LWVTGPNAEVSGQYACVNHSVYMSTLIINEYAQPVNISYLIVIIHSLGYVLFVY